MGAEGRSHLVGPGTSFTLVTVVCAWMSTLETSLEVQIIASSVYRHWRLFPSRAASGTLCFKQILAAIEMIVMDESCA